MLTGLEESGILIELSQEIVSSEQIIQNVLKKAKIIVDKQKTL